MQYENCLFACGSKGLKQRIPRMVWTRVLWTWVPVNTTPFVLLDNKTDWHCPVSSAGLWPLSALVAWENTPTQTPHRRRLRIMWASNGGPIPWIFPVATDDRDCVLPSTAPSHQAAYVQAGMDGTEETRFWIEVWHDNAAVQHLVTVGIEAPLLMAMK